MSKITYRKATLKDLDSLIDLWKGLMDYHLEFFPSFYKFKNGHLALTKKWFGKNIRSRNSLVMLAEDNGVPMGFIMIFVRKFSPPIYKWEKEALVSDLFVGEEYMGKGVAKKLFTRAKKFAKEKGADYLKLDVDVKNPSANRFYDKMGLFEFHTTRMVKL